MRLEQFYPYPEWHMTRVLEGYDRAKEVFWVQEEPQNMGAWNFLRDRIRRSLPFGRAVRYIGRPESANPACGSHRLHLEEQAALIGAPFE